MCDDPKELLATILNVYMPQILPTLDKYVVKGGRASDYYTYRKTGSMFITFTDWDIACVEDQLDPICRQIIDDLTARGIDVVTERIITHEGKRGIQLGFNCNRILYYFADVIAHPSNHRVFMNINKDTIKYIDYDYLLSDLAQTYRDRIHNLNIWLSELHIHDVTVHEDTYEKLLESISEHISTRLRKTFERDIKNIKEETDLTKREKREDLSDLFRRYRRTISELKNVTIPDLRERFEKLIRTKIRYEKLQRSAKRKSPVKHTRKKYSPDAKRTRRSPT